MEDWKSWCRLCACDGTHEVDVFYKEMENTPSVAEDLKNLCNLELERAVDLPTKICSNCFLSLTNINNFLTIAIKTQKMLTELLYTPTSDSYILRKKYKFPNDSNIKQKTDINDQIQDKHELKEDISKEKKKIFSKQNISKDTENEEIKIDKKLKKPQDSLKECEKQSFNDDFKVIKKTKQDQDKKITKTKASKTKENNLINAKHTCNDTKLKVKRERRKIVLNKFQCNLCEKKCISEGGLKFHMKIKHSIEKNSEKPKEFSCRHCDRKFTSESGRWSHIYTVHDKRMAVICEECGKEFSTKHHLARHKVSHKHEKNFQCHHCPARFKGKVGLAAHIQIHGESVFPCVICGIVLKTKQLMKNHMLVHSDVKNFKCNFCNKDFKRLNDLYYHLIMHIGVKPFECRICNEKFVHNMTYRRHLKSTHPKEFAEMVAKGERISTRNFPPLEQLKAINEAAKNSQFLDSLKIDKNFENISQFNFI